MNSYENFEQVAAIIPSSVIALIIVVSLVQLIRTVVTLTLGEAFQAQFGMIMTVAAVTPGGVYWLLSERRRRSILSDWNRDATGSLCLPFHAFFVDFSTPASA